MFGGDVIVDLNNGLSSVLSQVDIYIYAGLLIGSQEENHWNSKQNTIIFIHENRFQNICEMEAILSWS